ncbi:MAG: hypothetical protein ACT4OZ_00780 [Gemmatimonadota bacterium]
MMLPGGDVSADFFESVSIDGRLVLAPEYFASEFCQWELQLAPLCDPTGRKGIMLPLMVEPVALPTYGALIQAPLVTGADVLSHLLHAARRVDTPTA